MLLEYLKNSKINISKKEINLLESEGFVVLKRTLGFWNSLNIDLKELGDRCDQLIKEEGALAGQDGKNVIGKNLGERGANRLKNLLAKGDCFRKLVSIPDILFCCRHILGENFKLSSIDLREPLPNKGFQGLHLDWKQRPSENSNFFQCTAFILLDDVNKKNGAIRIIPKSHKKLCYIKSSSHLKETRTAQDHKMLEAEDRINSKLIIGKRGDIIILNVNSFHGGTNNKSGERRRLIHLNYRHMSLPLNIDQYEFIPKHLHDNFNNFEKFIIFLRKKPFYFYFKNFFRKRVMILLSLIKTKLFIKNK